MKIPLELIQPSPTPVRTTWDEDKMNELAQSIREQGVIVPIKVRPVKEWIENCPRQQDKRWPMFCAEFYQHGLEKYGQDGMDYAPGPCIWCQIAEGNGDDVDEETLEDYGIPADWKPYELVYGHRRVEAARRAELVEIEAFVEGVEDTDALIQALIENIQREDMEPLQIARGLDALKQRTGWTNRDIERNGIMAAGAVSKYITLLDEDQDIQDILVRTPRGNTAPEGKIGIWHVEATKGVGLDDSDRTNLLKKAASEGMTGSQTRRVAEAVAAAPSPEAKARLLETEYSPVIHDAELIKDRAARYGAHDPFYQDNTPAKQQQYDQTPEVKATVDSVIDAAKRWNELIKVIRSMTQVGKLAPESRQFIAHRARQLAKTLTDWANELETKDGN